MNKQKGFTLIELLVVIAIIGLLSTLAVISLNNARAKSRDAKRMADVKQMQSALELYYNDANGYPPTANVTSANPIQYSGTTYMAVVPSAPTPPSTNAYIYASGNSSSYVITFDLEGQTGGLGAGRHFATPAGVQ